MTDDLSYLIDCRCGASLVCRDVQYSSLRHHGTATHDEPRLLSPKGGSMSVAKVSEISATSTKNFEDAINSGLARAQKTIRNIRSAWIKEQHVRLEKGKIVEYQVNMLLTFVLDD
jgi:flavin-binding protein dodecin